MNFELLKKENILHDYEQVRLRNKRRLQERQEEIYAKIPEIKQLQSENKLSYIALAKKKHSDRRLTHRRSPIRTAAILRGYRNCS